jgi:hydroxypyruvate isomerase
MHVSASSLRRREFLLAITGVAGTALLGSASHAESSTAAAPPATPPAASRKGRLKQGICTGVFRGLNLNPEQTCRAAAEAGVRGIDLVGGPEWFPLLKKYGLVPSMVPGGSAIKAGINDPKLHGEIANRMSAAIKDAATAGAPNVIVLAGARGTFTDAESAEHCVTFLNGIKAQAEDAGVTLCLELLNSKVNHPGYVADHTAWGVDVCKRVNSPRVKLLYDIYHMQIMEGDVIRTIQNNIAYLGHFHTAGNPGRHQFDDTQELNYRPICTAIANLGYTGFISHEYTPTQDPLGTLQRMLQICEV